MSEALANFQQKNADLLAIKQPGQKLYFIGGVVRDLFLNRDHKDIDILCDCDTRIVARKLANQINGAFFVLDEERNTSRVVLNDGNFRQVYDFARLQGKDVFEDLALRDFTINAMAIDFDRPDKVIDPLNGQKDLLEKRLRCCSQTSFSRDPIRVIRAIRYSISCDVKIEPETIRLLKESISGLANVSWERKRDEFLKIFETEKPALGVELAWRLGILHELIEDSIEFQPEKLALFASLNHVFNMIEEKQIGEANSDIFSASFNLRLGRFFPKLVKYFDFRNLSDRNERQITLLTSFVKLLPVQKQKSLIQSFILSKEETNKIFLMLSEGERAKRLFNKLLLDRREIYLYFKEIDELGLDILFLNLAETLAQEASALTQDRWLHILEIAEQLIEAWFNRKDIVSPELLLNGKDLMLEFDLGPGPLIGILLDKLREEQAAGTILARSEALCWVEDELSHQEFLDQIKKSP